MATLTCSSRSAGTPGDKAHNLLFQNPGNNHHWIKLKLVGVKTNRGAVGAKIRADFMSPDGRKRSIHRTVGNNSSFGGNSLVQSMGLVPLSRGVAELTVFWPTSRTTQTFRDVTANQTIEITEGAANVPGRCITEQAAMTVSDRTWRDRGGQRRTVVIDPGLNRSIRARPIW